ncbi:Hint domain-containing protein [Paracoccus fistulariae]|nr:Hint domain-containing protein [Paracoccus fistulariae]MDB6183245.1 Hint domain-containing protein [Paracoccus fistulariae]
MTNLISDNVQTNKFNYCIGTSTMPTSDTFNVIYLGNLPIIDPIEGGRLTDYDAENANALVGQTFDSLTKASVQTFSPVNFSSDDGSRLPTRNQTYNQDNSRGNDIFNITDVDGNAVQHTFDAIVQYSATITYANGTTVPVTLNVMQSTTGETWIAPPSLYSPDAVQLGADPIQSIQLTGVISNRSSGLYFEREVVDIVTVPCFAAGTMIRTPAGDVAIETLRVGELVMTLDGGPQPVRWIGSRKLTVADLEERPNLRPIRIKAGVLGKGVPTTDLVVSPQHRILVRSKIAQRLFGVDEVLVAVKQLLLIDGIDVVANQDGIEYFHFLFDNHQVVISNGAETESLYTGPEALKSVGPVAQEEIFAIFPELRGRDPRALPEGARMLISGGQGRKLAQRHAQNHKLLVS